MTIALIVTPEAFPLAYEVLPGNAERQGVKSKALNIGERIGRDIKRVRASF